MTQNKFARLIILVVSLFALTLGAGAGLSAQEMMAPSVEVADQSVLNGTVTIASAYSAGPGFMVIHVDNAGSIGPVIGYRWLSPGANYNVAVSIDASAATSTLYAMLHVDDGEVGVYEFGTVEGADAPVVIDGAPVSPPFAAAVLNVKDQFVTDTYTAASVTVDAPGFLVIHSDNEGGPGPVLGYTAIEPGITADVAVTLDTAGMTPTLWPMLHVDTGAAGVYEFGTVEGADGPIRLSNGVATTQIWTVPHMRVWPQIVTLGDGMEAAAAQTVTAKSVLSEGAGWLVIHSEADGGPGPVAGFAPVVAGLNENVVVELDPAMVTVNLWPMLHVDTGEAGVYEFGEVEGADTPVRVNDQVVMFQIAASPSIVYQVTDMGDGTVVVPQALIDAPGWLVIHADNEGGPGPVLGYAPLVRGLNTNISITVDAAGMTANVFPMLHYDTGVAGVYEFGEVEGADRPIFVAENVVTGPAEVVAAE